MVSIIGGNVAGCSLALGLAKAGIESTLYEKMLWDKPCGGCIPNTGFFDHLEEEWDMNMDFPILEVNELRIVPPKKKKKHSFISIHAPFLNFSRYELQKALINRCQQEELINVQIERFTKEMILPGLPYFVASGNSSFSNWALPQDQWQRHHWALCRVVEIPYKEKLEYNTFIPNWKGGGYFWAFPKPNGIINLGSGTIQGGYKESIQDFYWGYDQAREFLSLPPDPPRTRGFKLPMIPKPSLSKIYSHHYQNNYFIGLGDTIGFTDPMSGAGIERAWKTGQIGTYVFRSLIQNFHLPALTYLYQSYIEKWCQVPRLDRFLRFLINRSSNHKLEQQILTRTPNFLIQSYFNRKVKLETKKPTWKVDNAYSHTV